MSEEVKAPPSSSNLVTHNNGADFQPKDDRYKRKWKSSSSKDHWVPRRNKTAKNESLDTETKYLRSSSDVPNSGSYASPEMQKFLGITTITPLPTDDDCDEDEEEDDKVGESEDIIGDEINPAKKKTKKKVALLIGFLGSRYSGFQMNANALTIQGELEYALYKAGFISRYNFGFPQKYGWSMSARTDKGVHSCGQVCSMKLLLPGDVRKQHEEDDKTQTKDKSILDSLVIDQLNEHLPSDISVMDIIQTRRKFCAKTHRDKVRYQYLIPSFLLCDQQLIATNVSLEGPNIKEWIRLFSDGDECTPEAKEMLLRLRKLFISYRVGNDQLERLASILNKFKGTHPFHNYTRGVSGNEPNAKRYIHSCTLETTYIDSFGIQWIPVCIVGQSFLLNQIRKMICMAVNVIRGYVSESEMDQSLQKDCIMRVNIAPPHGLFLAMSFYETHNRKSKAVTELKWNADDDTPAVRRWMAFKEKIMCHISEEESRQMNFIQYLILQEYYFGSNRGSEGQSDEFIQEEESGEDQDRNND